MSHFMPQTHKNIGFRGADGSLSKKTGCDLEAKGRHGIARLTNKELSHETSCGCTRR